MNARSNDGGVIERKGQGGVFPRRRRDLSASLYAAVTIPKGGERPPRWPSSREEGLQVTGVERAAGNRYVAALNFRVPPAG